MRPEHLGFVLAHLLRHLRDHAVDGGIHVVAFEVRLDGDVVGAMENDFRVVPMFGHIKNHVNLEYFTVEDISIETLRERDPKKLIPPLHGALIKNEQDVHLFERLAFMARREGR